MVPLERCAQAQLSHYTTPALMVCIWSVRLLSWSPTLQTPSQSVFFNFVTLQFWMVENTRVNIFQPVIKPTFSAPFPHTLLFNSRQQILCKFYVRWQDYLSQTSWYGQPSRLWQTLTTLLSSEGRLFDLLLAWQPIKFWEHDDQGEIWVLRPVHPGA